jgi:hypothetical protein
MLLTAFLAATAVLLGAASPAFAAPDENDSKQLRDALEQASRGHVEAKNKLDNSKKRQGEIEARRKQTEVELTALRGQVGIVAAKSYRQGRVSGVSMLLSTQSSDDFLAKITGLDMLAQLDARKLKRYQAVLEQAQNEKALVDHEVNEQIKLENQMARKVKDAEKALAAIGGGKASGGFVDASSPSAQPAPRDADGSWPKEKCVVDDPTPASGCITPRTLHALRQAQSAGFKRYASCHRSGGGGEHPLGRACDFAAASGGFENVNATGGDKAYGDKLAAYYVNNAGRLGVMYVIWYRQIWMPGKGWSSYSGGGGPAAAHTNHVHLSML